MSQCTPAPWGLLPYDTTDIHQGYSIVDANGKPIAAVKSEPYFDSIEQLEATARLIASAPEMLEALKDTVYWLERHDVYVGNWRRLIAKVEG